MTALMQRSGEVARHLLKLRDPQGELSDPRLVMLMLAEAYSLGHRDAQKKPRKK